MEDTNNVDNYKKGTVLMKSALKKYEEGDYEGGDKDREMANHFFDKREEETPLIFSEKDDVALYGENKNFGVIYKVFEENVKKIINEKHDYKSINKIVRFIKSNDILKEQFNCYVALKDKKITQDADMYLAEALSFIPKIDKKSLIEANTKLIKLLRECKLDESVNIDDEQLSVCEAIEFFILNTKKLNNIDEYNTNKNIIKEHLMKNTLNEEKETLDENDYNQEVDNVVDKYINELNEDEITLLKELNESDSEKTFLKYKAEAINFISEQIKNCDDISDKIDWNNIMTKVSLKQFNPQRVFEDVAELIEIQNIIAE